VPGTKPWGNDITDLAHYWKVVEYDLLGAQKSSFTDTLMAFVSGVAADNQGNVYVSGLALIFLPTNDPRLTERTFEYRVWRYQRGARGATIPTGTGTAIRTSRSARAPASATAIDPRGIDWNEVVGPALFVADLGNFRGEKIRDGNTTLPDSRYYHTIDFDGAPDLTEPLDITSDQGGFFYIADATGAQVLRYDDAGPGYVQRVERRAEREPASAAASGDVAADKDYVYVGDTGRAEIIRYKRRT
jgi:hypothetical protein